MNLLKVILIAACTIVAYRHTGMQIKINPKPKKIAKKIAILLLILVINVVVISFLFTLPSLIQHLPVNIDQIIRKISELLNGSMIPLKT